MGSYREAIDGYLGGKDSVPDVTLYRQQGRVKYGFGLNAEQELAPALRAFGRLGWNDGANESYAYTEIDRTTEVGADLGGNRWHRSHDKLGAAFVVNAISGDHRRYLALDISALNICRMILSCTWRMQSKAPASSATI